MGQPVHVIRRIILNGKPHVIVGTPAQAARAKVSRQNRQEYDTEKRMHELSDRMPCGHTDAKAVAIAKMTNRPESQVKKILHGRKNSKVVTDGKID